jgi:threonine dehydrogenase-like Zn-dependent dehydrogenase
VRAVIATGDGGVDVVEAAKPMLQRDTDAIVRVTHAAVCGTDLGLLRENALPRGTVIGHEFIGVVESAGSGVRGLGAGTRVVGCDYTACGSCWWCRSGAHWHCDRRQFFGTGDAFGPALSGAQAEYVRVPFADTVLSPVPEGVTDLDAVLLGDVLPTGWAAVHRAGLMSGETVVVIGGGPVGQVASLVAQAWGSGPVVLTEPDAPRREIAGRLGAIAIPSAGLRGVVDELTDGRGADVVIDAVGGQTGLDAALGAVRARGRIVSVGVPHADTWASPVRELFTRELTLSFAVGDAIRDRDRFIPLVTAGLLTPAAIVTSTAPLEAAVSAYEAAAGQAELKTVLTL